MGLYKRKTVWWMSFMYHGQQVRRSTDTADRRLAEAILAKITVDIVEGRYFEKREEQERTFAELMDRYLNEHVRKQMSQRSFSGYTNSLLPFFEGHTLAQITPKLIVEYKAKRYAEGVTPATINRELACMKKAFNLAIREWEWCRENPVARVSMEQERNRRDRWLSTERKNVFSRLQALAQGHGPVRTAYRHADGRDSRVDVGGSRCIPKNCDRVSVKERRTANDSHQQSRARCSEEQSQGAVAEE